MTAREKLSLEKLAQRFDVCIQKDAEWKAQDKKWKADIEVKINPLVEERFDRIVLQKYGKSFLKGLAWVVAFAISITTLLKLFFWKN